MCVGDLASEKVRATDKKTMVFKNTCADANRPHIGVHIVNSSDPSNQARGDALNSVGVVVGDERKQAAERTKSSRLISKWMRYELIRNAARCKVIVT